MMQFSKNTTDWWLAHWVTDAGNTYNNTTVEIHTMGYQINNINSYDMNSYLKIYIEFAVVNTIFTLIRAFIFAYGGITAALKFHKLLLKSVMRVSKIFVLLLYFYKCRL